MAAALCDAGSKGTIQGGADDVNVRRDVCRAIGATSLAQLPHANLRLHSDFFHRLVSLVSYADVVILLHSIIFASLVFEWWCPLRRRLRT
jgi:hypothetical protein